MPLRRLGPKDWSPKPKKKFIVAVREIHIAPLVVEARSKEEAIYKVTEGEGEAVEGGLEYSHTFDPDTWTVTEVIDS